MGAQVLFLAKSLIPIFLRACAIVLWVASATTIPRSRQCSKKLSWIAPDTPFAQHYTKFRSDQIQREHRYAVACIGLRYSALFKIILFCFSR